MWLKVPGCVLCQTDVYHPCFIWLYSLVELYDNVLLFNAVPEKCTIYGQNIANVKIRAALFQDKPSELCVPRA